MRKGYSIAIEQDVMKKIKDEARKQNRSVSNMVEIALKKYLESKDG
jgi:predicted transcriptional regulator